MKQSLFNMIYSAGSIQHICNTYFVEKVVKKQKGISASWHRSFMKSNFISLIESVLSSSFALWWLEDMAFSGLLSFISWSFRSGSEHKAQRDSTLLVKGHFSPDISDILSDLWWATCATVKCITVKKQEQDKVSLEVFADCLGKCYESPFKQVLFSSSCSSLSFENTLGLCCPLPTQGDCKFELLCYKKKSSTMNK